MTYFFYHVFARYQAPGHTTQWVMVNSHATLAEARAAAWAYFAGRKDEPYRPSGATFAWTPEMRVYGNATLENALGHLDANPDAEFAEYVYGDGAWAYTPEAVAAREAGLPAGQPVQAPWDGGTFEGLPAPTPEELRVAAEVDAENAEAAAAEAMHRALGESRFALPDGSVLYGNEP